METLILRAPGTVANPENFKRVGFSSFTYTADLSGTVYPAIMQVIFNSDKLKVRIEGATLYNAYGGVIDTANPYQDEMNFDQNVTGVTVVFAFVPTKEKGKIRISNTGGTFRYISPGYTAEDKIKIYIDPTELKNYVNAFGEAPTPGGYARRTYFEGDINGFSESNQALTIVFVTGDNIVNAFTYDVWEKPLPPTITNFSIYSSKLKADINLDIFKNAAPIEVAIAGNLGIKVFGSINRALANFPSVVIFSNYSQDGITGSLGSLGTGFANININVPNLTGGYTSRNWPGAFINLRINAPKVPAADWDLLLSDLSTKAPALAGGVLQINKRTAASDAHVVDLTNKGVSVIIGF